MIRLSGRFRSALIIGMQGIRARKLRTLLSMMSLFLGVLAVVVVQAGAETAKRALLSNLELTVGIDGTRMVNYPGNTQTVPATLDTLRGRSDAVGVMNLRATIGEPNVLPINPGGSPLPRDGQDLALNYGGPFGPGGGVYVTCDNGFCVERQVDAVQPAPRGQAIEMSLQVMTGDLRRFKPFPVRSGQWLGFTSAPSMSPGLVVNLAAAEGFQRYRIPAEMRIDGVSTNPTPRIIGVVDDGRSDPVAYMTVDELLNWLPATALASDNGSYWEVMFTPTASAVERTLLTRLVSGGLPAESLQPQVINSRKTLSRELALMRWIFLGMAALVLLIGVAGILNVGLATVGERVEEFALRRAVGTPRALLAGIVLAETLLTGLLTAGAAIGVAALAVQVVSEVFGGQEPFLATLEFPWQAGVAGVLAGLGAGLLGGFVPAVRAARIPIATVMRA